MKKSLTLCSLFLLLVSTVSAQSWTEDVVNTKKELQKTLVQQRTNVMRIRQPHEKISLDVTGWDRLSLYAWSTEDGTSYDQTAWGDAVLIANDGTVVKVSEMSYVFTKTMYEDPFRNVNFTKKPLGINGKKYEHGICLHANGEVVIDLGGKYTRFEAEVGIDDGAGKPASAVLMAQNVSANLLVNEIGQRHPADIASITNTGKMDICEWIYNFDGSSEKRAALNGAKELEQPDFYINKINAVTGDADKLITDYLNIISEIKDVIDIQNKIKWVNVANVRRAFDDMKTMQNYNVAKYEPKMKELEALASQGLDIYTGNKETLAKAAKVIELSREVLLSNVALDDEKIVLSRYNLGGKARSANPPQLGTQRNNWTNQMSADRLGLDAEIAIMSDFRSGNPKFETVYKPESKVTITDLSLHWDADKLLFTSINDRGLWNIFQVGIDGSGLKEVIEVEDPDLEFTDGTFLPSGKFIATSNIGYNGVPCVHGTAPVANMVLYDPETKSLRRLTFDQDANWHPVVANNGKVMYVRWEYTDLTHYFSRITMHMNPDGTEQKSLYGSGGFFPNSTFDIQPLPGNTSKFIGIISGHHGTARSGRLMLFDPAKSRKKLEGIVQEIPFSTREIDPIIKDGLVDGVWPQFIKPHPVTDKYFLVTAKLSKGSLWGVYLVDIYDNMTLVAENEGEGYINAQYIQKRKTPPVIPDKVNLESTESTVYIQDIYEGEGLPGVPRGTVKKLRLFSYEYAYIKSPSDHMAQGIQSGWDIKRLLGEVDVNADGSVMFKIPANTPISIQPLDSTGQALQWMRSWLTGMPGETVSCVGCHEDQNMLPPTKANMASKQQPQVIEAWDGYIRPFTYELEVQPILDRACVACHGEGQKAGMSFVGGDMDEFVGLSKSYLNLHPFVSRQGPEADALVMKPYEYHASTNELIRILKNGHYGVELTDKEWRTLYAWIDMNAPYHSSFKPKELNGYDQIVRRQELAQKYSNVKTDWTQEISDYAEFLESKGKIEAVAPSYSTPSYKAAKAKTWPFDAATAKAMQDELGETTKSIDLGNGVKMVFRKIPAGQFVMGNNKYGKESAPETKVKIQDSFWMGEIEVTNEQYNTLVPEHDSRYMAQLWKDHTGPGYVANDPKQPVIRISYNQAVEFANMLSEKTGLNIKLPTEAQWEWAARAGSESEFWFGNLNTDFGKYENMADVQLEKMAVSGVDPQPMKKTDPLFKYYNFFPKTASVDDNAMIQVAGKSYEANPWGLYDMLGNVREWTSSDYLPYPYKSNPKVGTEAKVVRGGSWIDRSKNSTSYSRKSALPWQPGNNVGFRLIIE
ncbi:MAG: SUMF1/EgtB/PvdO family nonheme iron enzyme [Rikenellaceae bacterium]